MFVNRSSISLVAIVLCASVTHAQFDGGGWGSAQNSALFSAPGASLPAVSQHALEPTPAPSFGAQNYAAPGQALPTPAIPNQGYSGGSVPMNNPSSCPNGGCGSGVGSTYVGQPGLPQPAIGQPVMGQAIMAQPAMGQAGCVNPVGLANSMYNPYGAAGVGGPLYAAGPSRYGPRIGSRMLGGLRAGSFYGGAEWLSWTTRGQVFPALITRSPAGTPRADAGVLGYATTRTLFGGRRLDSETHPGSRFYMGYQLPGGGSRIEAEYFSLTTANFGRTYNSPFEAPILARPFFNTFTGRPDAELIGFPGVVSGTATVAGTTDLNGWGIYLRRNLLCCCQGAGCDPCNPCDPCGSGCAPRCGCLSNFRNGVCCVLNALSGCGLRRADFILGYRQLTLQDSLLIRENLVSVDPNLPAGTTIDITDSFQMRNQFDGVDVGMSYEWYRGSRWGFGGLSKIALGNLRQTATINGSTVVTTPGNAPLTYDGGLLALPSNSGTFERDEFTYLAETGVKLFYNFNCNFRASLGYSLIYMPNVVRAAGLIDTNIDPRQLPPPTIADATSPAVQWREDDFWAQGINMGLEFSY